MCKDKVNVVYAANDKYAAYLGVSVYSLISNVSAENEYRIFVLNTDLTEHHKVKLKKLEKENVEIDFINVSEWMKGKDIPQVGRLTIETTFRLLVDRIFSGYDKILYLDCDTIIKRDVAELYREDISEFIVAASVDCSDSFIAKHRREVLKEVPLNRYFNSGVMLVNLPMFSKFDIGNKCFELLLESNKYICLDEEVLNITCHNKVKYIDGRWNAEWHSLVLGESNPIIDECKEQNARALEDPFIIHYVHNKKPWAYPELQLAECFWENARQTEFYEEILYLNRTNKVVEKNAFQRFIFPWKAVKPDENIILYGAGVVGRTFLEQIKQSKYCCVKAVCDANYEKITDLNIPVISVEDISDYKYDKIIIAIEKESVANEIMEILDMEGISKDKVFWSKYNRV